MRGASVAVAFLVGACGRGASAGDAGRADATACDAPGTTGCACAPVAAGESGTLALDDSVMSLVADPVRCRIYANAGTQILVIDTRRKEITDRVVVASSATDIDVDSDGVRLVVGRGDQHAIDVVDLETLSVTATRHTSADPYRVEVSRGGEAFYATLDQWSDGHRVDLNDGTDTLLGQIGYQVDLELSDDDGVLVAAESGSSSGRAVAYGVREGAFGIVDSTDPFFDPARQVFVSANGRVYYAGNVFSLDDLSTPVSSLGDTILAEDPDGRVAVGVAHLWDPSTWEPLGSAHADVKAAAFTAAGQELWILDAASGSLHFLATDELTGN